MKVDYEIEVRDQRGRRKVWTFWDGPYGKTSVLKRFRADEYRETFGADARIVKVTRTPIKLPARSHARKAKKKARRR